MTRELEINETEKERVRKKESHKIPMSEIIINSSIKELGEVIRLLNEEPRRQVILPDDDVAPKLPEYKRVGRP